MSWWTSNPEPMPYQYDTEEEYLEAHASWEEAESMAEDEAMERYYDAKLAGSPC